MPSVASLVEESSRGVALRDLVALTKPRITLMVLVTAAGGMWLAPGRISSLTAWMALIGTALIVSGANALNMYLEREIDGRMERTRRRPLPAGRLSPRVALWFGVSLSALAVPILAIGVNAATALLAVLANLSYVLAYTPMKQRTHAALLVGAVPGAIPPLLGWTAVTAHVDPGGLALFGVLFFWQIPHFHAIALFRKADYARAGLHVMPNDLGDDATRRSIVSYTAALVASTLLVYPLGVSGRIYLVTAFALGCGFLAGATLGLRPSAGPKWARGLFAYSLVYLVLLFVALVGNRPG